MSYCEHCEKEFPGLTCPVCGAAMLQELNPEDMTPESGEWRLNDRAADHPAWPLRPDGAPEKALPLIVCPDLLSHGAIAVTRLEAGGIPVLTRYPRAGVLGKLYTGVSGTGVELLVPESLLERARACLTPFLEEG